MFKIKFFGKLFAVLTLLLFSASAAAGQYCVKFPEHWANSKWSKRDNDIGAQFVIHYDEVSFETIYDISRQKNVAREVWRPRDHFWNEKKWRSSFRDGQQRDGYFKYCADMSQVAHDWPTEYSDSNGGENHIRSFRMSVIWGADCPHVKYRSRGDNVTFTIRRRKNNHVFPWACG